LSTISFEPQALLVFLVAEGSRYFIIFVYFINSENGSTISCDDLAIIVNKVASSINSFASLVLQDVSSSTISTVADDDVITILVNIKFTNKITYSEFR